MAVKGSSSRIAGFGGNDDLDLDAGLRLSQLGKNGRQQKSGVDVACRYDNLSFDGLGLTGRRQRHSIGRLAHGADMVQQVQPVWRQGQPTPDTFEQNNAKLFFKRINLPAQSGLRKSQCPRRGGQRALFSRDEEGPRPVPVESDGSPIHARTHIK
jgi:hypothetical protein